MGSKFEPLAVSAAEAARLLGVSRPTVYNLLNREDFRLIHLVFSFTFVLS